ncbi:MAG: hypothetical protein IKX76_05490 [Eubacterium sp.]|nr:hypothetical protein [Eubacterium sp.]
MKKKRTLLLVLIALLAMACPVAAASQKAAVKKAAKGYLQGVKTMNSKKIAKYVYGGEEEDSGQAESSLYKIIRKYNKKYFTFKIKSVTLSEDQSRASVKVTIKYKSLYKAFYKSTYQTMQKAYKLALQGKSYSEKQILKDVVNKTKKNVKKYKPQSKTKKMTLKAVKTEAGWKVDTSALKTIDPFVCDMVKGVGKAQTDFEKKAGN